MHDGPQRKEKRRKEEKEKEKRRVDRNDSVDPLTASQKIRPETKQQ